MIDKTKPEAQSAGECSFQARVHPWMLECFGGDVPFDVQERGDRFLEESLELLQANGYDVERIPTLVNYVYGRPVGARFQEVGGVMVTLAAYCTATGVDMQGAAEAELARILQPATIEKIRSKQAGKRDIHGPLPGSALIPAATPGDYLHPGARVEWQDQVGRWWPVTITRHRPESYDAELDDGCDALDYPRGRFRRIAAQKEGNGNG